MDKIVVKITSNICTKLEMSKGPTALRCWVNGTHGTDRRTDRRTECSGWCGPVYRRASIIMKIAQTCG